MLKNESNMRRIYYAIALTLSIGTAQAQLKTVSPSDAVPSSGKTIIETPQGKNLQSAAVSSRAPFTPVSMTFQRDAANGLTVLSRDADALPIFISGNPKLTTRSLSTVQFPGECKTVTGGHQSVRRICSGEHRGR